VRVIDISRIHRHARNGATALSFGMRGVISDVITHDKSQLVRGLCPPEILLLQAAQLRSPVLTAIVTDYWFLF